MYQYPESIILSSKDYQEAYEQEDSELTFRRGFLLSVLAGYHLVFVGFSMEDPYFNKMLEIFSKDFWGWDDSTHFAIMSISPESAEDSRTEAEDRKSKYGVATVFYENYDKRHQGLEDIVDEIAKSCHEAESDWLKQTNLRMAKRIERKIDNEINREKLLKDLQNFTTRGNGVIIGSPGVGKTYLLSKLHQSLKSTDIRHLLLPIDKLGNGTDTDLQSELLYEGDLIEKLKSVPVSDQKAILLFDAFDAARNEDTRQRFLHLIQRAIHELSESWNVIVTVRTYDAQKSLELLDLFGYPDDTDLTEYHSEDISCQHFTIPLLNENEIRQALTQLSHPKAHIHIRRWHQGI